ARHWAADSTDGDGPIPLRNRRVIAKHVAHDRDRAIQVIDATARFAVDILVARLRELIALNDEVEDVALNRDAAARTRGEARADHGHASNCARCIISEQAQTIA